MARSRFESAQRTPHAVGLQGKRFSLVAAQFHPEITQGLIDGALEILDASGVERENIRIASAPGAFEIPFITSRLAASSPRPDAIIALGAVIRGETFQYKVLAKAVAQGLMDIGLRQDIPVTFGVIVAETLAQAKARARRSPHNRGAEAARAAVEVVRLYGGG